RRSPWKHDYTMHHEDQDYSRIPIRGIRETGWLKSGTAEPASFQLTRSAYERDRHRVAAALDRHRVAAAFLAISVRRLPERLFARAAPPLRPSSTAALLFPSIVGCSSRGGASFAPWAVFS